MCTICLLGLRLISGFDRHFLTFLAPIREAKGEARDVKIPRSSKRFACVRPVSTFPQNYTYLLPIAHFRYFTWKFLSPDGWVDRYWNKMRIYVSLVRQQLWKFCYAYHSDYMVVVVCQWHTHPHMKCLELTAEWRRRRRRAEKISSPWKSVTFIATILLKYSIVAIKKTSRKILRLALSVLEIANIFFFIKVWRIDRTQPFLHTDISVRLLLAEFQRNFLSFELYKVRMIQ